MEINDNKLLLAWPNHVDQGSISGGSYRSNLPLSNAKNRIFAKKARSTDLSTTSTTFDIILNDFKKIDVLAIAAHNFTTSATVQWKLYNDSAKTDLVYDSGVLPAWPVVFADGELEWEENNYWEGTIPQDDVQNYTPLSYHIIRETTLLYPAVITCQITDSSNPAGYVEFGRVFVGSGFQPNLNMKYGASLGFDNSTTFETSQGQTEYFDVKIPRRTAQFTLDAMSLDEGHGTILRMQRQQGVDKEVFFTYLAAENPLQYNRTFIARLRQADAISQPYVERLETQVQLLEII